MKASLFMALLLATVVTVPGSSQSKAGDKDDKIRVIQVGEISKIDTKNNVIIVKGTAPGGAKRGTGGGIAGDIEDDGFPPGGDFPGTNSPGRRGRMARQMESKVNYSSATVVKEEDKTISIQDLKVGDFVRISGRPKDRDIDATEIARLHHSAKKG